MQISQSAILRLCCASFLAGLFLALLYDVLYVTRLGLIPPNQRYTVPAIQNLYAPRIKKETPFKTRRLRVTTFLDDLFFCIAVALTIILLLFWLNNGVFRAAAPLCAAIGFGLWRICLSKVGRTVLQWVAFGIETVVYTLLMPFKHLFALIAKACKAYTQKRRCRHLATLRQRITKRELQSIDKTAEKLSSNHIQTRMQKGEARAKQTQKSI